MESKSIISVIISAKNEEKTIEEVIWSCQAYAWEVLVIDGHSTDNTREVADRCGARVILDNKKGKGDAIKVGAREAKGDILIFIDADGSHEAGDIPKLAEPILQKKADMVVASRMLGGSDELHGTIDRFIRNTGNGFVALLINLRFKTDLTDIENGFRAVKKGLIEKLNLKRNDFVIEQEMVVSCLKKGFKISEVASHEHERKEGESKLPTIQGFKFIWHILFSILTP